MLLTIEHNGTQSHVTIASQLKDLLEEDLGYDNVEVIVSNPSDQNITIYDQKNEKLGIFHSLPSLEELKFYIGVNTGE